MLVAIASVGLLAISYVALDAKTKVEAAVSNSWQAKNMGEKNTEAIKDLKDSMQELKEGQKNLNDKYDRNQEDNQKVFRQILAAVK